MQDQNDGQPQPTFGQGQQPNYPGPQWGAQPPYQPQYQMPTAPPPKKMSKKKGCGLGCLGAFVLLIVVVIISVAATGGKSGSSTTAATAPTTAAATVATQAAQTTTSAAAKAAATTAAAATSAAPATAEVVFKCTGKTDGNGIDITYGPEGTEDSASSLPFTKTMPLDDSAQYYDVTAQLQGSGQVTCSTTVEWSGGPTVKSGSASGGYNIADAEVCSDFTGGWTTC